MGVVEFLSFFKRSNSKLELTYKTSTGNEDCKSYSTIAKAMSYGSLVHIPKRECIGCISSKNWKNQAHPIKKDQFFHSNQFFILLKTATFSD